MIKQSGYAFGQLRPDVIDLAFGNKRFQCLPCGSNVLFRLVFANLFFFHKFMDQILIAFPAVGNMRAEGDILQLRRQLPGKLLTLEVVQPLGDTFHHEV